MLKRRIIKNLIPDSFLFWYPKIRNLDIPQPKTETILLRKKQLNLLYEGVPKALTRKVEKIITQKFKLPVFIRTDLASAKHSWEKSCFYDGTNPLWKHISEIVTFNLCADVMGLPFRALVVREFIPMDSRFTAFRGNMPVNPERRYFINKGKVLCHHPYWIEDAIRLGAEPGLVETWRIRGLLQEVNRETTEEIRLLTGYAEELAEIFSGYWSVDFCKAKDRRWILIDMATGEKSWHPKCKLDSGKK